MDNRILLVSGLVCRVSPSLQPVTPRCLEAYNYARCT